MKKDLKTQQKKAEEERVLQEKRGRLTHRWAPAARSESRNTAPEEADNQKESDFPAKFPERTGAEEENWSMKRTWGLAQLVRARHS